MKIIKITQYDQELKVFTTKQSIEKYCKKNNYLIEGLDNVLAYALHYEEEGNDLLMYIPKEYNEELVDHELIHITWYLAKIIGHPLNFESQEFQTYLFTDLKRKVKKQVYKL